jgi:hypothetical protein
VTPRSSVQPVDRRPVDRYGQQLVADLGEHTVLVRAPTGESRQKGFDTVGVGVEDVGAVRMHEDAVRIVGVVGVAADVTAPFHEVNAVTGVGERTCRRHAGEPHSHDEGFAGHQVIRSAGRSRDASGAIPRTVISLGGLRSVRGRPP